MVHTGCVARPNLLDEAQTTFAHWTATPGFSTTTGPNRPSMMTTLPPSPPWTPMTDITAPSPGPANDLASSHIVDPSNIPLPNEIDQEGLSKAKPSGTQSPALIPLPPSPPPAKHSLPFRRPPSAPHSSRRVSSNTRLASGRRVSGALQYAFQRTSLRGASDASSLDLAYYEEMRDEALNEDGESERPQWDSALGFGGVLPDSGESIGARDEDEAWMGYVRQQLNNLFPDLFHADQDVNGLPALDEEAGDVSVSTIATSELPTPPWTGAENNIELLGSRVPNVREEIGGLRDEIERLRGVVSGLAEGLRVPPSDAVPVNTTVETTSNTPDDVDAVPPEAFFTTAAMSANIIRLLHHRIDGARSDAEPDHDELIFSEVNLARLLESVGALSN